MTALGPFVLIATTYLLTTSTDATCALKSRPRPPTLLSAIERSSDHLTSSAVNSCPKLDLTPLRRLNVKTVPPPLTDQLVASFGTNFFGSGSIMKPPPRLAGF